MKVFFMFAFFSASLLFAENPEFNAKDFGYIRIFRKARKSKKWKTLKTLSDRMMLIRKYALKHSVASNPVSSRYLVTCYGGSIDLVHFLGIGAYVCANPSKHYERLFQEWVNEGGYANKKGFNFKSPPEATPDDLPSNALGALWGYEISSENTNLDFDLEAAFTEFMEPLKPVPDSIVKYISYKQAVLDLKKGYSRMDYNKKRAWFTAMPLIVCEIINNKSRVVNGNEFCEAVKDGKKALRKAGFKLCTYQGKPIIILRK